jgi:hypothetical protein
MFWTRPDGGVSNTFVPIPFPSEVDAVQHLEALPSWSQYPVTGSAFVTGPYNDNLILTADMALSRLGVEVPPIAPAATLVAGPGLTNNIICYWSYYDAATDEDSQLSGGSATLAAANQAIQWPAPPAPQTSRPTHVSYWRSVDGSLPRLVMRREIGVGIVTEAIALGGLGQSFTDVFVRFPRCRFCVVWHDRLVMAGDDLNPNNIYLSLIGKMERQSALTLTTKSGKPVTGLVVVKDTLIVLCGTASEIVTGWSQDDIAIVIAQPQIGCISHFAVQLIHGLAFIPTHLGTYICDGSSWMFVSDDIRHKWVDEYALNPADFEKAWSFHDPNSFAYGIYLSLGATDVLPGPNQWGSRSGPVWWVADYRPTVQQVGGGYGQPNWSYDSTSRGYYNAYNLAVPTGRRSSTFIGGNDGNLYRYTTGVDTYNAGPGSLLGGEDDSGDALHKRVWIRTGADAFGEEGGDFAHGKNFCEVDLFMESEWRDWVFNLYAGDEQAYKNPTPLFTMSLTRSAENTLFFPNFSQAKSVWPFVPAQVSGNRLVIEILATAVPQPLGVVQIPGIMEFRGFQVYWKEGETPRYEGSIID